MAKHHRELIAREGWVFLVPLLLLTLVSLLLAWAWWLSGLLALLSAFVAYFFRNPYRQIPESPNAIVSPADGKVVSIHRREDGRWRISIFLNIFNVHVNRCPIAGKVASIRYTRGKFLAAQKAQASAANERNALVIADGDLQIEVVQIAGLIARRIVCWIDEGARVAKGERFGLIRFGSRVDLILPGACEIAVKTGQKVTGGSDVIARKER